MIGSVAASKRAAAFARALDEHELDEARAADRTAEDQRPDVSLPSPAPVRSAPSESSGDALAPAAPADADAAEHPPGDACDAGDCAGDSDPELLLGVARRLRSVPRPAVPPDVKIVQRAQLVAAMEAEFASPEVRARQVPAQRDGRGTRRGAHRAPALGPLSRLRPNSRLGKGLAAGGLGVGVAASALGGVAAASSEALPGDSLYGVKRGMEDLRLDFADDDRARGRLHLDRAATRLREARRLMERARGGAELDDESLAEVRRALAGVRYDATEGHHLLSAAYERDGSIAPMRTLSTFNSGQRENWTKLREHLPEQLYDVRDEVSSVFDEMDSDITPIAGLISEHDDTHPQGQGHGGASGHEHRGEAPRPSSPSDSSDPRDGSAGTSDEPSPSGTDARAGGLIGGEGLLGTPGGPQGDRSRPGSDRSGDTGGKTEVTLPPIVPDTLPGLKRLSEDYE
ncbi:DUF5667 domain-containing protein [Streptomyces marispadix]|uniref:DUF5667 domain-containing protein n=1 Tax=Streptomyces marispadix TaxID=2922868 RepID=A0ABS9T035_9ACTN|nr:DUF5667 domain-containing protein [Streptomyces marispadix]MCH6161877.1 DUF5667 domain-containing protein [Streptomyces marispadix]